MLTMKSSSVLESVRIRFDFFPTDYRLTVKNLPGIVRSVETASDKIYLLPAINKTELHHVNVIAICNVPLPPALLLNQSSRIGGRIPYVYSSDNFVGSKKNVPNSCRPEKRMSNHHITLV